MSEEYTRDSPDMIRQRRIARRFRRNQKKNNRNSESIVEASEKSGAFADSMDEFDAAEPDKAEKIRKKQRRMATYRYEHSSEHMDVPGRNHDVTEENSEGALKTSTLADKLKGEKSASEAMRKKLRHGREDITEDELLIKRQKRKKKQQRKKSYEIARESAELQRRILSESRESNSDNVADESIEASVRTAAAVAHGTIAATEYAISEGIKKASYSQKLHKRKHFEEESGDISEAAGPSPGSSSNKLSKKHQKNMMKKEIQEHAVQEQVKEAANGIGNFLKGLVDKAEDIGGMIAEFIAENPEISIAIAVILLIVLVVSGALSSCSMMASGVQNASVASTYTAEDPDIIQVDDDYVQLETDLRDEIANIETDNPGYDEYQYDLAEIGHNPFELAALLTVLYENYTPAQVQARLQDIYDLQYTLTLTPVTETRYRTETDPDTGEPHRVPYDYHILKVKLINNSTDYAARNMGLTADELDRYELLLSTYGNKEYLFADSIYNVPHPGDDYDIPSEALTDVQFANMIREAQRYLDTPYVWGGYSPSGFDCSGFVSYVVNHCGNGWNIGRQTANGLLSKCNRIPQSEAKPGDLIFFQGTYEIRGASHVGIYVGNGMMIHCGHPVQFSSVNTPYWRNHFLTYGRLDP